MDHRSAVSHGSPGPTAHSRLSVPAQKGVPVIGRTYSFNNPQKFPADPELHTRAKRVAEVFSEALIILGNEPSLGLYRVQEHVRRSVPIIVDHKKDLNHLHQQVQGVCFDTEYASSVVEQMHTITHFSTIQEHLNRAIGLKQSLDDRGLLTPGAEQSLLTPAKSGLAIPGSQTHADLQQSMEDSTGSPSVQRGSDTAGRSLILPGLSMAGARQAAARRSTQQEDDLVPKKFT